MVRLLLASAVFGTYLIEPATAHRHGANPIRRVVTMLQQMAKKAEAQGKKEDEMFHKFMCYCETGGKDLTKSVETAEAKIPQLESGLEGVNAEKSKLTGDIAQHKADREEAKNTLGEAAALREKEAASYASESAEDRASIDAMTRATAALEKGMGGGAFLQTSAATRLRALTTSMDMSPSDRDMLSSFLAGGAEQSDSNSYSPQAGEIVGILKQMADTLSKQLAESTAAEQTGIAQFEAMVKAKEAQSAALTRMVEEKTARLGEVGVMIVQMGGDLDDTSQGLEEDKSFLTELEKDCSTRKSEYETVQQTRQAEQLAIAETIKLLNDDDAAGVFTKSLPAPSFLQARAQSKTSVRKEALAVIKAVNKKHPGGRLAAVTLAIRSKKTGFDKVLKMIDGMVTLLAKEQADDDEKKDYCNAEIDSTEDRLKSLKLDTGDADKALNNMKEKASAIEGDIASLEAGMKELDKQVAEATESRKEENDEFTEAFAQANAAKQILGIAKNHLQKFYNPKLHKEAPKRELSEQDQIVSAMGGEVAPEAPAGGIAGSGVEAASFLQTMKQEAGGVLALIDMLVADLDKQIVEMKAEEDDSQTDYERVVKDSADKRAMSAKTITEKDGAASDLEEKAHNMASQKKGLAKETEDTTSYMMDLHKECDWLLANHGTRTEARDDETEALKKAKSVLSGAS